MKAFSPAGLPVKGFFGLGAKTFANPQGHTSGNGGVVPPNPPPFASTWHAVTPFSGGIGLASVAWGNGEFMALDRAGNAYTSADGITWSAAVGTIPGGILPTTCNLIFNNGAWIAGLDNQHIARSINGGVTWTVIATGSSVADSGWVVAEDNLRIVCLLAFDAGSAASTYYAKSNDNGLTWTPVNPGFASVAPSCLPLWNGTEYVFIGSNSGNFVVTSIDGTTWVITASTGNENISNGLPFLTGWAGIGVDAGNNSRATFDGTPQALINDAGQLAPQIDPNNTTCFAVAGGSCFAIGLDVVAQSQNGITYATGTTALPATDFPQPNTVAYSPTLKRIVVGGNSVASTGSMMYANL